MGRLFYVNRKIEGQKLCQVVARDLLKRIPPKPGHKAALRDPGVELDVSGKAIEDGGLQEVVDALLEAVTYNGEGRVLRLEEASFRNNKLTSRSLASISRLIRLSASELKDLDLSNNQIQVNTAEDAIAWEEFLLSFAHCNVLRRLDLSGNTIGAKGYEILAKVYEREREVTEAVENGLGVRWVVCGLKSVPYLILFNTGMDDLSALHLSYVINSHRPAHQLLRHVPPAKAGTPAHQLEAYDHIKGCSGIVWKPNPQLGSSGLKVLDCAEDSRVSNYEKNVDDIPEDDGLGDALVDLSLSESSTILSTPRQRRGSTLSTTGSPRHWPVYLVNNVDRARSRIQGDTIKDRGIQHNDLWWSAMKMLTYARAILLESGTCAALSKEPNVETKVFLSTRRQKKVTQAPATTMRILSGGNPNASVTPRNPQRKKQTSYPPLAAPSHHNTANGRANKERPVLRAYSTSTKTMLDKPFGTHLPHRLPEAVWMKIIAHAAGAHDILSQTQQEAVIRWATQRGTLGEERSASGKHESTQIWKILSGMGCLAYSIDLE